MRDSALSVVVVLAVSAFGSNAHAHGSRAIPAEDAPVVPLDKSVPARSPEDEPVRAPGAAARGLFDWSGFYVGGHIAYSLGNTEHGFNGPSGAWPMSEPLRSVFGGVQLGYNVRLPSRLFAGGEADITFPYFANDGLLSSRGLSSATMSEKVDYISTLRARLGYAGERWMVYGTYGLSWAQERFGETPYTTGATSSLLRYAVGWAGGAGVEYAFSPAWTFRLEYLMNRLGDASALFPSGTLAQSGVLNVQSLRLGMNWHFRLPGEGRSDESGDDFIVRRDDFTAHFQTTLIEQGYFAFHSPYQGPQSLSGGRQFANTVSATAFLGLRLWKGGELYVNPEVDQGFGLSDTLGVAAFPNGEAQKAAYPVPRLNIDRLMIRQTFGLGGDEAAVPDGANQLQGTRDISRVTVTAGRYSVGDLFGLNTYAADPRTQFFNWNIYGSGSYDWVMDKPGFTWGIGVELNQKRWALRAGYYLEPTMANGNSFDMHIPVRGQYLLEPEVRYALFGQPGRLRVLAWLTHANLGSYEEAIAMSPSSPDYANIVPTREIRTTYGFVANVEQALSSDLGLFSRASWTPGKVEVLGWTDCDESFSLGGALSGGAWSRPHDTIGLAGVIEGLSPEARAYFEAGGMGILIGDGRMNYAPEEAVEAYYALSVSEFATLTFDYQIINNPAYNRDRGPIPIYGARLHVEL